MTSIKIKASSLIILSFILMTRIKELRILTVQIKTKIALKLKGQI